MRSSTRRQRPAIGARCRRWRAGSGSDLGPMPEWNLADLYPGPKSSAVQADLEKAADEAHGIKQRYQGKLVELGARRGRAGRGDRGLRAPERHHRQARLLCRPALCRRHVQIPSNAKFYGDIQEKITAITTDLIFFELELNKIDEAELARALGAGAGPLQALDRRLAQGEALSAGRASWSGCSTRRRSPRAAPGAGSSTRP